jgi:hypothetical protein
VRAASEAALWSAIEAEGLLGQAIIPGSSPKTSDNAGQFRVGELGPRRAPVHKLVPANDKQGNAVAVAKPTIWWFYRRLKEHKLAPGAKQASLRRAQFDRIFKRGTGYAARDRRRKQRKCRTIL